MRVFVRTTCILRKFAEAMGTSVEQTHHEEKADAAQA